MWRTDRKACAALALMTFASVAGMTPAGAQSEGERDRAENRSSESVRQAPHPQAQALQSRSSAVRTQAAPVGARGLQPFISQRTGINDHPLLTGRINAMPQATGVGVMS